MSERKKIITHSGPFHVDDVFAVATLDIYFRGEYELIRTRDLEIIKTGDIVLDVGGVLDREGRRFDHHQVGGAGERDGVPYSSLGLIWEEYGEAVCGSAEVAGKIEEKLILAEDALDNGVDIIPKNDLGLHVTRLHDIVKSFQPSWNDEKSFDEGFLEAVGFAKGYLERLIHKEKSRFSAREKILEAYQDAEDKRIIVFDRYYPGMDALEIYDDPLYFVYPSPDKSKWSARGVRKEVDSFETRKMFPEAWAGKLNAELSEVTGIPDALFCHNKRWICSAVSKEGTIALAKLAAENK